jgi:hypothetical protein
MDCVVANQQLNKCNPIESLKYCEYRSKILDVYWGKWITKTSQWNFRTLESTSAMKSSNTRKWNEKKFPVGRGNDWKSERQPLSWRSKRVVSQLRLRFVILISEFCRIIPAKPFSCSQFQNSQDLCPVGLRTFSEEPEEWVNRMIDRKSVCKRLLQLGNAAASIGPGFDSILRWLDEPEFVSLQITWKLFTQFLPTDCRFLRSQN